MNNRHAVNRLKTQSLSEPHSDLCSMFIIGMMERQRENPVVNRLEVGTTAEADMWYSPLNFPTRVPDTWVITCRKQRSAQSGRRIKVCAGHQHCIEGMWPWPLDRMIRDVYDTREDRNPVRVARVAV